MTISIRPAIAEDSSTLLRFIVELAAYEKAEHEVSATVASLEQSIFGEGSVTHALICEKDGVPIGMAVFSSTILHGRDETVSILRTSMSRQLRVDQVQARHCCGVWHKSHWHMDAGVLNGVFSIGTSLLSRSMRRLVPNLKLNGFVTVSAAKNWRSLHAVTSLDSFD
jgi:hypothetical protein